MLESEESFPKHSRLSHKSQWFFVTLDFLWLWFHYNTNIAISMREWKALSVHVLWIPNTLVFQPFHCFQLMTHQRRCYMLQENVSWILKANENYLVEILCHPGPQTPRTCIIPPSSKHTRKHQRCLEHNLCSNLRGDGTRSRHFWTSHISLY